MNDLTEQGIETISFSNISIDSDHTPL